MKRFRAAAALCAMMASWSVSSCSERGVETAPERLPHIILIVIDTLRADRLGCYGNPRGLTPFMNELAARGVRFSNAYAPSSWTIPSIASLFTSRYAMQHNVVAFESKVAEQEITLAETLADRNYLSGGFTANFRLTERLGYAQGFDFWRVCFETGLSKIPGDLLTRGDRLRRESLTWLDGVGGKFPERPVFLYLHYMEPHSPYLPPPPYRSVAEEADGGKRGDTANEKLVKLRFQELSAEEVELLAALYDGEVASVDAELRALFLELEERGFLDRAIVVVTADHGEEFREHGGLLHGFTLYDESLRIPLIMLLPADPGGRVIEENVSLLDLAPTLLDLVGLPPEGRFEGRSLKELLEPPPGALVPGRGQSVDVLAERPSTGSPSDVRRHSAALLRGPLKILVGVNGDTEIFDLSRDATEMQPNPPVLDEERLTLQRALSQWSADLARRAGPSAERQPLGETEKERLRALGYVVE